MGYISSFSGIDNNVVLRKWDGSLTYLGKLGGVINADEIFSNLINNNINVAAGIWWPYTFRNLVKSKGEWVMCQSCWWLVLQV
jgi:hypothetical protein